ncbi:MULTISPECIES: amidohydrolase [unclassified Pseudomonas]|uniref:amidohydrolase family protein n=1 Tax=unclassified Pseudomonas TaxID=196821 RepID=UPI000BCD027A|nr:MULTISPECIES: amidohydrolase family protein [unclassified Pseudomonas]PVZ20531.1 putative TIM-barrel fold metal-dependent hydrolase [Pseudomonas sp. URIL14HWK12:I12]PVZ27597.1 putative TIM-barrel fold metal-dependent hydrolase [Pseudomonas sp. URIL14HWK12:I10]PVZ38486.1 putative TIM-barrel fold metal-dependent hydrolase [Pseudomonas sp. URIL14HWK12:I11]SNZ03165.1 Predicted metal-dependent hydrolase, TIM-barrel fold [Pseudomonas sp. URIL14HWK12:I9]
MNTAASPASPHAPVRQAWLSQVSEPALDPQRPIVDAHHHLWDRPGQRYLAEQLLADTCSGHNIVATVYLQCRSFYARDLPEPLQPVGEVEFAAQVAHQSPPQTQLCAAIIAGADLRLGDAVAPVLEAMLEAGKGRLRGVRNATAWHADPRLVSNPIPPPAGVLAEPGFRRGAAQLARFGLGLDIWAYHTQLPEVLALAHALPDQPIVLNHLGGPLGAGPYAGKQDEVFAAWSAGLKALAQCPNVWLKLGGLAMRVGGFALDEREKPAGSVELAQLWAPYMLTAIELFGSQRCLFESNFPVDKGMVGYAVLWNAFKRITAGFSEAEKDDLFSGSASRCYRLTLQGQPGVSP